MRHSFNKERHVMKISCVFQSYFACGLITTSRGLKRVNLTVAYNMGFEQFHEYGNISGNNNLKCNIGRLLKISASNYVLFEKEL